MDAQNIIDIFSQALFLVVSMVFVIIVPSLVVGLIVSVFQAATQINEQTLSFLPRLIATLVTVLIAGPWLLQELNDLFIQLFQMIASNY